METDKQTFKTVATFVDAMSANLTAGMLNENGIPAAVIGADSSYPSLGYMKPIEVKVNEDDYELAMSILAASDQATEPARLLSEYGVRHAVYGHLHGAALKSAFAGEYGGVVYHQVSCDGLGFRLAEITSA